MARGLSSLQREILCLASEKRFVTYKEMIEEFWGLQDRDGRSKERTYDAAHASLSRSVSRLWARNLVDVWKGVTGWGTGVTLTGDGEEFVLAISAEEELMDK